MVLKLESKRCAGLASSTYRYRFKFKLAFPHTRSLLGEPFPSPARQKSYELLDIGKKMKVADI